MAAKVEDALYYFGESNIGGPTVISFSYLGICVEWVTGSTPIPMCPVLYVFGCMLLISGGLASEGG